MENSHIFKRNPQRFDQFAVGLFTRTRLPGNFKPVQPEDDYLLSFFAELLSHTTIACLMPRYPFNHILGKTNQTNKVDTSPDLSRRHLL